MFTYQDFMELRGEGRNARTEAVDKAIKQHIASSEYKTALDADNYDRQQNTTMSNFYAWLYNLDGTRIKDPTANVVRMCSNAFRRLNVQRVTYSLGNGITFETDGVKEMLGREFDTVLHTLGYYACIHGTSFAFLNVGADGAHQVYCYKLTEFVPMVDEFTGELKAGIRFWQIAADKPMIAVLYEVDGFTRYQKPDDGDWTVVAEKRAYKVTTVKTSVDDVPEVIAEENYNGLPIVPFYGSVLKQSTLVGLKSYIDAEDMLRSGFVDDLQQCAQVYWLMNGAGGMSDDDLKQFRDRLKYSHIAASPSMVDDVTVSAHTVEPPYQSRSAALAEIHKSMYDGFGGLDVHTISAGSTNDHIDAAYQPMDENADDFEYQIITGVRGLLALLGVHDETPIFKRNRISNQREQVEMVIMEAPYLDDETILKKLPNITPDEIESILSTKAAEDIERFGGADEDEAEEPVQ